MKLTEEDKLKLKEINFKLNALSPEEFQEVMLEISPEILEKPGTTLLENSKLAQIKSESLCL